MQNTDFFIKRGDRSPEIAATLKDRNGAPVDVTGMAVKFKMRSFDTGTLIVNGNTAIVDGPAGKVKYVWQTGDTAVAGFSYAEWEVTLSAGVTQTFPTAGWHLINVVEDLDDPGLSDTDFSGIRELRRIVPDGDYSDSLLAAMMGANDGSVNATAGQVWREKAVEYAALVDITESGSSRKMSQLYDRAVKQAGIYESAAGTVAEASVARPRVGRIVRQP